MSQKPEHFTEFYSLLIESRVAEPTIDFTDGEIYRPSALENRKHGRDRRATIYRVHKSRIIADLFNDEIWIKLKHSNSILKFITFFELYIYIQYVQFIN